MADSTTTSARVQPLFAQERDLTVFRELVDAAQDAIICVTSDGRACFANRRARALLHLPTDGDLDLDIYDYLPTSTRKSWPEVWQTVQNNGFISLERKVRAPDRTEIDAEITCVTLGSANGEFIAAFIRDVTARVQLATELQERTDFLDSLYSGIEAGVFVVDIDDSGEFRFSGINPALQRVSGVREADLVGKTPADLSNITSTDAIASMVEHFRHCKNSGETFIYETTLPLLGADTRWLIRLTPVRNERGTIYRIIGSAVSRTEEVRSLAAREALENRIADMQRYASLAALAGGVSHELNNLLTTALGNTDLLLQNTASGNPQQFTLTEVRIALDRMSRLSRQLLDFSGRGTTLVETLNLSALAPDLHAIMRAMFAYPVVVECRTPDAPVWIRTDRAQFEQAVLNLVTLVHESLSAQPGSIIVSLGEGDAPPDLTSHTAIGQRELPPSPHGYGWIDISARAFGSTPLTPPVSIDPTDPKFSLALAAVYTIATRGGGALYEPRNPAERAYRLILPCSPPPTSQRRYSSSSFPVLPESPPVRTRAVLVVDDEDSVRVVIARILEEEGIETLTATSGHAALTIYEQHMGRIGLVLLDMTMPGLDGPATLAQLRALDPAARVILMSGYSHNAVTARVADNAIVGFLPKPFALADLLQRVESALAETRA